MNENCAIKHRARVVDEAEKTYSIFQHQPGVAEDYSFGVCRDVTNEIKIRFFM